MDSYQQVVCVIVVERGIQGDLQPLTRWREAAEHTAGKHLGEVGDRLPIQPGSKGIAGHVPHVNHPVMRCFQVSIMIMVKSDLRDLSR